MEDKRIVRVIAQDKRYTKTHFRSVPMKNENLNTYLTGQHIDPNDEDLSDGLTVEQMRRETPLRAEQLEKFGYIINPDHPIMIRHSWQLDITVKDGKPVNPKDYWEFQYLKYQPSVAPSKDEYNVDSHRFYIEDKEQEAVRKISKRERVYKALENVRKELSLERLSDIAIMLNYYIPTFRVDPKKVSKLQLEDMVYEQCEQNPEDVSRCFEKGASDDLYVLKLADNGIITRKGNDFYDGSTFLGQGLDEVKKFMTKKDNLPIVNKWASLLKGNVPTGGNVSNTGEKASELFKEGMSAVIEEDKAKISYIKEKLSDIGAMEQLDLLMEAEKKFLIIVDEEESKEEVLDEEAKARLLTLKQKAGRLKLPKEIWGNMSEDELTEYLEENKGQ